MENKDVQDLTKKVSELSDQEKKLRDVYLSKLAKGEIEGPSTNYPHIDKVGLQNYSEEDISRGYVEVANRRGIIEQFPITAISIGVVEVEPGEFSNPLEIGEVGAQVKHLAKEQMGSAYVINRRKN